MNFDLNLGNYKTSELEEIFDLPQNYDETILKRKADVLREKIESDQKTDRTIKIRTLEFLLQAKNFLLEGRKKMLSDIKLEQNIYHTDLELKGSAIFAENGSQFIIDRSANSTPYNVSFPGDTFPGVINPLKKRTIIKNLNIDTRFRDNYFTSSATNFHFDLPYKFSSVTLMHLTSFQFVQSYYAISACLNNNSFSLQLLDPFGNLEGDPYFISVPDGNYTGQNLMTVINTAIGLLDNDSLKNVYFSLNESPGPNGNKKVTIGIKPGYLGAPFTFSVNFILDQTASISFVPLQQKFGWILGFRLPVYTGLNSYTSESVLDISGPKYIYLVVDDFNNNVNENFFSAFTASMLNKNILARIAVPPNIGAPYITFDLTSSGSFSTPRTYFGPVDIQKMQIQLLDEYGRFLNLNGTDYSFVLALTTAYDI
uniref:Uncharacterized protein n=1 Tax=viral metagenome TaxID=1070528 RepID=A0A6C0B9U7_9ZZZZ